MRYSMPAYLSRKPERVLSSAIILVLAVFLLITLINSTAVYSQEKDYPEPIYPPANATDVPVTKIVFSWKPFYVATNEYTFQLSKNNEMDPLIDEKKVNGTTYQYLATLEYDTTYYWKIWASDPLGGQPVTSIFITESKPVETAPPAEDDSSKSFFESMDMTLIGIIAGGVIVVLLVAFVFLKPRLFPSGAGQQAQWQSPMGPMAGGPMGPGPMAGRPMGPGPMGPGPMAGGPMGPGPMGPGQMGTGPMRPQQAGPQQSCPSCGMQNMPGKKFCGNCGTPIAMPGQQPATGIQQTMPGQQIPPAMPQTNTCTTCGTSNPPDRKFCGNCGSNLAGPFQQQAQQQNVEVIQSYTCPICGAVITANSNPCSNCGTWLDWG